MRIKDTLNERRRFLRLQAPIAVRYIDPATNSVKSVVAKNISADGLRFETDNRNLAESSTIEIALSIPDALNPVHARGTVIWKKKISLEDNAPYDVGVELTAIEEDNKNTFLKFLCDMIYNLPKERASAKK